MGNTESRRALLTRPRRFMADALVANRSELSLLGIVTTHLSGAAILTRGGIHMITSDTAGTDESSQPVGLQFSNGIEGNKNPSGYVDGTLFALGTAAIIGGRIGYSIERRRENK